MAAVRGRDTKPEVELRRLLYAAGLRYRVNRRLDLPGIRVRPDITFIGPKVAVFVDGCFWHVCPEHATSPKNNEGFWAAKLARNVERDQQQNDALESAGWTVIRVWEHEPAGEAAPRVMDVVRGS